MVASEHPIGEKPVSDIHWFPSLLIRGEPERAPNTREARSGVYIYIYIYIYIFIYLCVILHGNDSMHMLRHHVVDLP